MEYEQRCEGLDTISFGDAHSGFQVFFYGTTIGTDFGYTFNATVKSLWSNCSEFVYSARSGSDTDITNVTITSDEETNTSNYTGLYFNLSGQSGNQSSYNIRNTSNCYYNFTSICKKRTTLRGGGVLKVTGELSKTVINIFGDTSNLLGPTLMYNAGTGAVKGIINYNVKATNIIGDGSIYETSGMFGGNLNTVTTGIIFNVNTNIYYTTGLTLTQGIFNFSGNIGRNVINYNGNITLNTVSGVGMPIVSLTTNSTIQNIINFNGDITYLGTGSNTAVVFKTNGGGIVNYSGNISGTFSGPITNCLNGTININNSYIKSSASASTSTIIENGSTSLGTVRINNSYIELNNSTNPIGNGSYVNAFINNSTIINSGTGSVLSNATSFGSLRMLHSTIITGGSLSIDYRGTASVISGNVIVNATYSIVDIIGGITTLNELGY